MFSFSALRAFSWLHIGAPKQIFNKLLLMPQSCLLTDWAGTHQPRHHQAIFKVDQVKWPSFPIVMLDLVALITSMCLNCFYLGSVDWWDVCINGPVVPNVVALPFWTDAWFALNRIKLTFWGHLSIMFFPGQIKESHSLIHITTPPPLLIFK